MRIDRGKNNIVFDGFSSRGTESIPFSEHRTSETPEVALEASGS